MAVGPIGDDNILREDTKQTTPLVLPEGPTGLKMINTNLSADRKHVSFNFVMNAGQILTVRLETAVAVRFHQSLGEILKQPTDAIPASHRWN